MRMLIKYKLLAMASASVLMWAEPTFACKIFEDFSSSIPMNAVDVDNAARIRLADAVIRARSWPDVEIGAELSTPALSTEHDPKGLSSARASAISSFLVQLGVKQSNIYYEPVVIRNPVARDEEGLNRLREIYVSLAPICANGCDRLCNDPRVTPVSKAIR